MLRRFVMRAPLASGRFNNAGLMMSSLTTLTGSLLHPGALICHDLVKVLRDLNRAARNPEKFLVIIIGETRLCSDAKRFLPAPLSGKNRTHQRRT